LIFQSNSYAAAHTLSVTEAGEASATKQSDTSMTALLVEYLKLIILFLLIGIVIGLSELGGSIPVRRKILRKFERPASAHR
jgi:hypothetical protein